MIASQRTETWLERSMALPVHKKKNMKNIKSLEEFNSSEINEAKELAWIDKGDPEKEVRVMDNNGYVTIMQKDFDGRVVRVLIDTKQVPQLIAALKKAK